jgi:DNA-binding CsgD family transcriptional regulator
MATRITRRNRRGVAAVPMDEAEPGIPRAGDRTGRGLRTVLAGFVLVYGVVSMLRPAPLTVRRTVTRPPTRLETLSPYQRRVLHLMSTGMSNLAIAAELGVSRRAIENQVSRLMQALGLGRDNDALAARVCAVLMYLRETRPHGDAVEAVAEPVLADQPDPQPRPEPGPRPEPERHVGGRDTTVPPETLSHLM